MSYHPGGSGTATVSSINDVPGLPAVLDSKAPAVHNHDGVYATTGHGHSGYASGLHSHSVDEVVGLQTILDGKQAAGFYAASSHDHNSAYEALGAVAAHAAAVDPHTGYQKESEKAQPNGYASLDGTGKVPSAQLPSAGQTVGYVLNGFALNAATTTDGQTIYWGLPAVAPSTTGGNHRIYVPKDGTVKSVFVYANAGTAGTGESWTCNLRLNNTSNTLVQALALANANRVWSNTALSVPVVAGNYLEIQMVNPTWATNPANVRFAATIYIE